MSRKLRMDTDGSIVCTNNRNVEYYQTDLRDLIDLYSDEAKGVAENPQVGWAVDPEEADYGRYYVSSVVRINEYV